jgi:hypothetical protein
MGLQEDLELLVVDDGDLAQKCQLLFLVGMVMDFSNFKGPTS